MAIVTVRVDDELKRGATELFNNLGFDMSTAVKMFLLQAVHTKSNYRFTIVGLRLFISNSEK